MTTLTKKSAPVGRFIKFSLVNKYLSFLVPTLTVPGSLFGVFFGFLEVVHVFQDVALFRCHFCCGLSKSMFYVKSRPDPCFDATNEKSFFGGFFGKVF